MLRTICLIVLAAATAGATGGGAAGDSTIREPRLKKRVQPVFPERAIRAGLNGIVIVETKVGFDGRVEDAKVLRGYRMLGEAAVAAIRQWQYAPTVADGKPVEVTMTNTVNFQLERRPSRKMLIEAMQDADPDIRWSAANWLSVHKPATVEQRQALEAALQDADPGVAKAARESLEKLAQ